MQIYMVLFMLMQGSCLLQRVGGGAEIKSRITDYLFTTVSRQLESHNDLMGYLN